MKQKWTITIMAWIGIILFFVLGSRHRSEADLFVVTLRWSFLLVGGAYIVAIWLRDLSRGRVDRTYHLSAYPRSLRRFITDEPNEAGRQSGDTRNIR